MGLFDPLRVIFPGRMEDGTKIVLYQNVFDETELAIKVGDAEVQRFPIIVADFNMWNEADTFNTHLVMKCPYWEGEAVATRQDFIETCDRWSILGG